jgi:hypothetical protein
MTNVDAMKRRRRFTLALAAAVTMVLAALLYVQSRGSLDEFMGRDLRKLHDGPDSAAGKSLARFLPAGMLSESKRLERVVTRRFPAEPPFNFSLYEPWYLWRVNAGRESRLVLFQGCTVFPSPGGAGIRIVFLDPNGDYTAHTEFSAGSRVQILDAALTRDESVIEIQCSFWITASLRKQFYALHKDRVALVRLEDASGQLTPNDYQYGGPWFGPKLPARTADEWEDLLLSAESVEVLEALMWVGGSHHTLPERWPGYLSKEQVEAAKLVAAVRGRPNVKRRIAELSHADDTWVREAAVLAGKQL